MAGRRPVESSGEHLKPIGRISSTPQLVSPKYVLLRNGSEAKRLLDQSVVEFGDHCVPSRSWYVAETLPRAEGQAERHIQRQGFACFCPRFSKQRRHARRIDHVLAPVFPNYIFVRLDLMQDRWASINGTIGVKRLVGGGSQLPQAVPNAAMQALLARCNDGVIKSLIPDLHPGQRVQMVSGPFTDHFATIERLDGRGRVRILLNILGGVVPIRMLASNLSPARLS